MCGVNVFICIEVKVLIDYELIYERLIIKGKKIYLWIVYNLFIICYLNVFWIKIKIILDG